MLSFQTRTVILVILGGFGSQDSPPPKPVEQIFFLMLIQVGHVGMNSMSQHVTGCLKLERFTLVASLIQNAGSALQAPDPSGWGHQGPIFRDHPFPPAPICHWFSWGKIKVYHGLPSYFMGTSMGTPMGNTDFPNSRSSDIYRPRAEISL